MAIITLKSKSTGALTFQVKVRDHAGRWFPCPTFKTREEAVCEEARLLKLRRKGLAAISPDAKENTVADYWSVWSIENRTDVSAGWKISQNQMYRDYILPIIGEIPMGEVGAPEIGRVLKRMADLKRGDQMRLHVYRLLRKMFSDAVEYYEMLPASPVKPKFHRPKVVRRKRDFLLPAQALRLMEYTSDTYLGPAVWLQLYGGLRVSEVQALRWECVRFVLREILIRAAFNNKVGEFQDYPKQEEWGQVPMVPRLAEYLWNLRKAKAQSDFVAPGPKGKMLSYETYHRALKRACLKAGVPAMDTHELRHSATEIWIEAGASQEDIRRLLNHSSDSATKNYIHRTNGRLTALAERVGGMGLRAIPSGHVPERVPELEQKGVCLAQG